jgi:hypothetical protein
VETRQGEQQKTEQAEREQAGHEATVPLDSERRAPKLLRRPSREKDTRRRNPRDARTGRRHQNSSARHEAARRAAQYIKQQARLDHQQLLYPIVDKAVRLVGKPAAADTSAAPARKQ